VAVGVCDSTFMSAVECRFQEAGWRTFEPEGVTLAKDGWPEFLEALAGALDSPDDFAAVVRVARHPVVWTQWLPIFGSNASASLAVIERWEVENAVSSAGIAIERLRDSNNGGESLAGILLQKVHSLVKAAAAGGTDTLENSLRGWFQKGPAEAANHALAEMESWERLHSAGFALPLRLKWLATSLASVSRSSDLSDAVLALQGWLELPFDPSPHLILAGLHEGSVPEAPPADPLITEAVREQLGLRTRKSRLAREVFLYTALVEGRRASGSVTVVTAQVDAQGEPCKPSRVLLHTRPEMLPARVLNFVKEKPDVPLQHTPPWTRGDWRLAIPPVYRRNQDWTHLSPSTLKAYLACPTRFYFTKVLCWERFEPFESELDSRQFGVLLHAVLSEWGNDTEAREITDPAKLKACWLELLKRQGNERFGASVPPLIRLQIMSAQERLMALADEQARQRQLGWHVAEVEKELNGVLTLAGKPVNLRIDRIDQDEDGNMRLIDYKTGKTAEDPFKAYLRAWSEEKCSAALGPLCVVKSSGNGRDKSYGWTDLQLPLYAAVVQKKWSLTAPPKAFYVLMPEAVGDTEFVEFAGLDEKLDNALEWAAEAVRRIVAGVFWPPAPEVKYDDLAAVAPEGLRQALGGEWAKYLAGNPQPEGGNAP
jgi:ATP-dependent helicase/nuclease subunit B